MKPKVRAVGKGLIELGLEPFHTVAILGHNDPAWHIRSSIFETATLTDISLELLFGLVLVPSSFLLLTSSYC